MNYIFITIIITICFFCLMGTIHSIAMNIERRKMIEAFCKMYEAYGKVGQNGENGMSIDEIIAAVKKNK